MADDTYIRNLAQQIRSKFNNSDLPDKGLDELFNSYAVLALSKGKEVTNEDVHDAWSAWATKYDPNNKSLLPFNELSHETQQSDTPFTKAIKEVINAQDK